MTSPDQNRAFESWLQQLVPPSDGPAATPNEMSAQARRWLRELFEVAGPVSYAETALAFDTHQAALAHRAVNAVVHDLRRTTSWHGQVDVEVVDHIVHISIDGSMRVPSMIELDDQEALAEVASYFQEQLAQILGLWPVCVEHDTGLHPEVRGGRAGWWCRRGGHGHGVAVIGGLDAGGH